MIKIGITGSIASGKTTASKIISLKRGPLFSADDFVKQLYRSKKFKKIIIKKFSIKATNNFKAELKKKLLYKKANLKKLTKLIHPLVRKEMFNFIKKNKSKSIIFLEIPLLIESKLMNYFDLIIFIKSNKRLRLKRYVSKGGDKRLFSFLDNHQMKDSKKLKYCDYVVVNNKSLSVLKRKLLNIIE